MKDKNFDVPILLVIFRRKDTALRVMDAIAKVKPEKLYISQDGPRTFEEAKQVNGTREAVLSKITWECNLTVWIHDRNLGLKKHIPEAFDRFFEKEEYGIYLEDDTLPSKGFFYFQKQLLEKYKNDNRIFSINGTNFYPRLTKSKHSYYLSKLGDIWGFGLWKRSWKLYDGDLKDFANLSDDSKYNSYFFSKKHKYYLETFWKAIVNGKLDSWAMQLVYSALKNKMYFIAPRYNMVNNIGVNKSASNISLQTYYQTFDNPFPIKHPKKLIYSKTNDLKYFRNMLKGGWIRLILIRIYLLFSNKLKIIVNNFLNKIFLKNNNEHI